MCLFDDIPFKEDPLLAVWTVRLTYVQSPGTSPPPCLPSPSFDKPLEATLQLNDFGFFCRCVGTGWGLVKVLDLKGGEREVYLALKISQEVVE